MTMETLYGEKYTKYRNQWDEGSLTEFPLHIDVDLQDACNQRCNMCHQRYRTRTGIVMPTTLLEAVIDEGADNGLCAINFGSSAEPLLQKDLLLHGINYANDKGIMDIFVHTNGVLLDEEFASRLLDSGLKHLCISLDAANEETYRKTRNSDLFNRVVNNIHRFCQLRKHSLPTVRLSFCVNPLNYLEADRFLRDWVGKVDLAELQGYRHVGMIELNGFHKTPSKCVSPFRRIMVWSNGDVTLCCGYRSDDVLLGNLNKSKGRTLVQMWKSSRMHQIRKAFQDKKGLPKTCQICLNSEYTQGDK